MDLPGGWRYGIIRRNIQLEVTDQVLCKYPPHRLVDLVPGHEEFYLTQNQPLLSIITPSFNRADMIGQAIESVINQGYSPVEHIIIDGASTDGTLDLLARYPHLKVFSAPDNGMYDALNKGLRLAQGEIIGFLNSDDLYAPGAFNEIMGPFADATIDAVAGRAEVFYMDEANKQATLSEIIPACPQDLLEQTVLSAPGMNAWFFRRRVFDKIGSFDAGYRFAGDREFMIRLALAGMVYERIDRLVYRYRRHPGALTFNWNGTNFAEIAREHLKMTDGFLGRAGLPKKAGKYLKIRRTRDTVSTVISLLHRRMPGKAWFYVWEGLRTDWSWPFKLVSRAVYRLNHPG
jgi:glycosyltransferase involved in cell wall biosynthesis